MLWRTLFLLVGLAVGDALWAQPRSEVSLRIVVVRDISRAEPPVLAELRESPHFDVRPQPGKKIVDEDYATWADAILLLSLPASADEAWAQRLDKFVEAGAGLVVSGAAVCGLEDSVTYSNLLGRSGGEAWKPQTQAVVVARQSHPVTQCLTHFLHAGMPQVLAVECGVLAAGDPVTVAPKVTPVTEEVLGAGTARPVGVTANRTLRQAALLWTHRREKVVVSALDLTSGRSTGAARTILKRALEWVTLRRIRTPLAEPYLLSSTVRARALVSGVDSAVVAPGQSFPAGALVLERGFSLPGQFFLGRQCAPVMTYHGAEWLLRPDRETTEQPDRTLAALKIQPGSTVVDLGAGNGYFSLRMARLVGDEGRVLAVDIQPEMLELLKQRAREAKISNVECVLATEKDPGVAPESADLTLLVDVYHELATPQEVLSNVHRSLKPNGRLVLVEYRGEDPTVAIKPLHRMLLPQIRAELLVLGFEILKVHEFLPNQRIVVAGKRPLQTGVSAGDQ
jgi:SAM-dependent methyltransferase